MQGPVEAEAQLEEGLPEFLADPRGQPDARLDLQGLDEVGLFQGEGLVEPPPEEGLLGLGALGELGQVPHQDRWGPEVVQHPAGGALGQGGQGLGQLILRGGARKSAPVGAGVDPMGFQPHQGRRRGLEEGQPHGLAPAFPALRFGHGAPDRASVAESHRRKRRGCTDGS